MRLTLLFIACLFSLFAKADSLLFEDFADLTLLQLNGSATYLNPNPDNVLSLTNHLGQSGSAFFLETVSLDNLASFSVGFEFQISDPQGIFDNDGQGADGIAFVVQPNASNVGGNGGGIGYKNIDNSLAIEFDTWRNRGWDGGDGNHVGINIDGDLESIAKSSVSPRMNNGAVWTAWIDYDGLQELVEVRVSDDGERPEEANVAAYIDLRSTLGTTDAYIGFTSGTGGASGDHDILSMMFYDDYSPVSEMTFVVTEPSSLTLFFCPIFALMLTVRTQKRLSSKSV